MTVLDFELFKDQKKLDKEYLQFMGHCNRFFGTDVSSQGIFKRLYFATRYLEGTVNGYTILSDYDLTDETYNEGIQLFCAWLEAITKKLRG